MKRPEVIAAMEKQVAATSAGSVIGAASTFDTSGEAGAYVAAQLKGIVGVEIPIGRIGKPEDIAAVASFLCREEAGYVSGQVIYVAGGPRN